MFCSNCGCELQSQSKFCHKCGQAVNTGDNQTTHNSVISKKDIDTEALKIYVTDILSLECMISKLANIIKEIDKKYHRLQESNYYKEYVIEDEHCRNNVCRKSLLFYYNGAVFFMKREFGYNRQWIPIEKEISRYGKAKEWNISNNFIGFINRFHARNIFLKYYTDFKNNAPKRWKENDDLINNFIRQSTEARDELKTAAELLEKEYDLDIIPKQYRNISAIYFLHDFISTSNETLTTALPRCNLDKIQQQLDSVIQQQKESIINQAIIISQNEEKIRQNQQTLNRLAAIERNTANGAKYAKIAANNAETCAWIGVANYIQNSIKN